MLNNLIASIPNYAKDIKLNISSLLNSESNLTKQQFWGILLSCAMASKNKPLFIAINQEANKHLSEEAVIASKSAASLMAMNNIYYRFTHLVSNKNYSHLPANLRMNTLMNPGIEKIDFELFSLAVSTINGCGKCMDAHEKTLLSNGATEQIIQAAVRIASIIHAVANVLETT